MTKDVREIGLSAKRGSGAVELCVVTVLSGAKLATTVDVPRPGRLEAVLAANEMAIGMSMFSIASGFAFMTSQTAIPEPPEMVIGAIAVAPEPLVVSLNSSEEIDPARVLRRLRYAHPLYSLATVAAQARRHEINGVNRSWFAGAYWGWGFHEDGMRSAVDVAQALGETF